jgi:hypothetical protein
MYATNQHIHPMANYGIHMQMRHTVPMQFQEEFQTRFCDMNYIYQYIIEDKVANYTLNGGYNTDS